MFAAGTLPAEAATLRDIGHWASENSLNALAWLVEWWTFHHCLIIGACDLWDISIGFLILDALIVISAWRMLVEVWNTLVDRTNRYRFLFDEWRCHRGLQKAATRGSLEAQLYIARFCDGQGSRPRNNVEAYAWYSIAAAQNHAEAVRRKETLRADMTAKQIAQAQKLSSRYWEKYVAPFQKD